MEFMYQLQQILSKEAKSVAILFLSYGMVHLFCIPSIPSQFNTTLTAPDLAPIAKYPRQLQQAASLLSHVLQALHIAPDNIILTGDSAGANLALALLSHTLHPHPSAATSIPPVTLSAPLRGLVLTSPWVSFSTAAPAFLRNAKKDLITPYTGRKWSAAFMGSEPPHNENADEYNQPIMAPPSWWQGFPAKEVLIVAGKDEILVDDIVIFAGKLEEGMAIGKEGKGKGEAKVTLFVAEGECHDQTNLDVQFGYRESGEQTRLIRRWIGSKL
jgi:acetyl esterase/lipase